MSAKVYRIIRIRPKKAEYLAHRGHDHYWTDDIGLAMEYTKLEVAKALCIQKTGTEVQTTTGDTVFVTPLS